MGDEGERERGHYENEWSIDRERARAKMERKRGNLSCRCQTHIREDHLRIPPADPPLELEHNAGVSLEQIPCGSPEDPPEVRA